MPSRFRLLPLVLALGLAPAPAWADPLSDLPNQWQGRLQPIPDSDISGAERLMREAIRQTRSDLGTGLTAPTPDPAALADGYGRLGALFQLGEVNAGAELAFRNARALQPEVFRWPYYLGYLALREGRTDQALEWLREAERLAPGYPPLQLRLGEALLDRIELDPAQAAFEQAANHPGLRAAALYHLGRIATLRRNFELAVQLLDEALRLNPKALEAHYPLAQAYRALGRDDLARDHLSRFVSRQPDAEDPLLQQLQGAVTRSGPLFNQAIEAVRNRDFPAAARHFAAGLEIDPENQAARVSYGRVLFLGGDPEGARRELERAAVQGAAPGPKGSEAQALAQFMIGVLEDAAGRGEEAMGRYRRTLELAPDHSGAHYFLANRLLLDARPGEAARHYVLSLAANRDNPPARLLELVALQRDGMAETQLLARIDSALAESPEQPAMIYALARLLAAAADPALRNPQRALILAQMLVQAQPIPPNQALVALALAAGGDFLQAAQIQQQVIYMAGWLAPKGYLEQLNRELAGYQRGEIPQPAWSVSDPMLAPPPLDPAVPFRDYPAAIPY